MCRDKLPVSQICSETILNMKINHDLPDFMVLGIMKEKRKYVGRTSMWVLETGRTTWIALTMLQNVPNPSGNWIFLTLLYVLVLMGDRGL